MQQLQYVYLLGDPRAMDGLDPKTIKYRYVGRSIDPRSAYYMQIADARREYGFHEGEDYVDFSEGSLSEGA